MLAFLRFLKGYLKLHISGYSPERFMNLCRLNGIILWDIIPLLVIIRKQTLFYKKQK